MTPPADTERYKNHRFPGEIISHGVWLYYRFTLSCRDVQELLFKRGIDVSHEAIRQWCRKSQVWAGLRKPAPAPTASARGQMASGNSLCAIDKNEWTRRGELLGWHTGFRHRHWQPALEEA